MSQASQQSGRDQTITVTVTVPAIDTTGSKRDQLVLSNHIEVSRSSIPRPDHHYRGTCSHREGEIHQYGVLNQFHAKYVSMSVDAFGGPAACCGYFSCAHALIIEQFLTERSCQDRHLSSHELSLLLSRLRDEATVDPILIQAFTEIQQCRREFYEGELSQAKGSKMTVKNALKQWVANYEIGEFLKRNSRGSTTHFMRHNQYPFLEEATPDERPRIMAEEERFGGHLNEKGESAYYSHDSVFFMQSKFGALESRDTSCYYTPEEWQSHMLAEEQNFKKPQTCVIDLAGHFVCGLVCELEHCDPTGSRSYRPSLIIFNTTVGDYVNGKLPIAWTFDSFFAPTDFVEVRRDY